jgi:hypothetical protein
MKDLRTNYSNTVIASDFKMLGWDGSRVPASLKISHATILTSRH